jgi:hypothetical protein
MRIGAATKALLSLPQRTNAGQRPATSEPATRRPDQVVDVLELSIEGKSLARETGATGPRHGFDTGGPIRIENVQVDYEKNLSAVQSKIESLFAANGIESNPAVRLQIGLDGRLIVADNHPQAQKIEPLVAEQSGLRDQFAQTSAQARLLKAAEEAAAFQKAYRKDPIKAVADYAHLFGPHTQTAFQLSFKDGVFSSLMSIVSA